MAATQGQSSLGIEHRPCVHDNRRRRDKLGTAELQTQEQGRLRASGRGKMVLRIVGKEGEKLGEREMAGEAEQGLRRRSGAPEHMS
ncbi:hypothetical protein ZEAMMB73_Zm00001d023928 [Zea mays]|jgi:hypothetical protein|uniref:Uncharacterized protein n=1 Tax=Zea mays TaxID=4577 RepID=A0A1D6IWV6_MAIZE|nr:hypothetical protein ZEAMMB73_Zm00001d023928 [Zea mays]